MEMDTTTHMNYEVPPATNTSVYILHYYNLITIPLSIAANTLALILVCVKHQEYNFKPYICGILLGNLCFLVLLATNVVVQVQEGAWSQDVCGFVVYGMAVTQHVGTCCLAAVAVERYVHLTRLKYMVRAEHRRASLGEAGCRHWVYQVGVTMALTLVCCLVNVWVTELVIVEDGVCSFDMDSSHNANLTSFLMLFSVVIAYLLPFLIACTLNICVIRQLCGQTGYFQHKERCSQMSLPNSAQHDQKMHKKRVILATFLALMLIDMLLNFPHRLMNIAQRFTPTGIVFGIHADVYISAVGYILWHAQFGLTSLFVLIPLFRKRKRTTNSRQNRSAAELLGATTTINGGYSGHYLEEPLMDKPRLYANAASHKLFGSIQSQMQH